MRLERFINNLPVGFAFDHDLHIETVISGVLTATGKIDGTGTVLNDFGNRRFHSLLICAYNFIHPETWIMQISLVSFIYTHNAFRNKNLI
jgi:hypothetical protein